MKPTLVVLPGYDGDGTHSFAHLKRLIERKYTVVSLDYPYTDNAEKEYSLDELTFFVHRELTQRKMKHFHLMGFSMGGFVATRYAEVYPTDITALTLISSSIKVVESSTTKTLMKIARVVLSSRVSAHIFTAIYNAKVLEKLTGILPVPRVDIPNRMGYAYYGTLAHVIRDTQESVYVTKLTEITCPKNALLFRDDMSFPARAYAPLLKMYGVDVTINERGGHATAPDYWDQVATYLISL